MSNTTNKAARKVYAKPQIAVEDFKLNHFIASCTIKTRDNDSWQEELQNYSPFMYNYIQATGQFAEPIGCSNNADDDMDTLCYHTSTSPLFTS